MFLAGSGEERPLRGSNLHTAEGKHTRKIGRTTNRGICIFFSGLMFQKEKKKKKNWLDTTF